jgi:hypothetical protein
MESKFNILTWFKTLSEGWKIASVLFGAVIVIATAAVKIDHFKDRRLNQENVIEYLKKGDQIKKKQDRIRDSIDLVKWKGLNLRLYNISDSLGLVISNHQKLVNSVATMGLKVTSTVPELFKLMNGLQFELIPPATEYNKSNSYQNNYKIKVVPIAKPDSIKR